MQKIISFLLISILFISSCTTQSEDTAKRTVLSGATLYDGNGNSIENSIIIIKDGVIETVGGQELTIPEAAEIIDVSGQYITPGLIDAHIHFAQTGFFDGRPDVVDLRDTISFDALQEDLKTNPASYYEAYLRSGVTGVYDVGGFLWSVARQDSAENNLSAPHVAAAGPLSSGYPAERLAPLNTTEEKQMLRLSSAEFGRETVKKHTELGSTGIKIWGLLLQDTAFMEHLKAVADETSKQGNKLIVHSTSLDQAKEALRLGAKVLVHSVDNAEVDDEFIALAQANDVVYLPTMTVIRGYLKTYRSLLNERAVEDPNNVMDERAKNFLKTSTAYFSYFPAEVDLEKQMLAFEQRIDTMEKIMAINIKKLYDAGITIAVATDAGNPGTFHGISIYDEMEAMQKAGIAANDLISMATKNGALAMDRSEDIGTLEKGKMADLIILTADPAEDISNMRSITHVMRGGLLRPVDKKFE